MLIQTLAALLEEYILSIKYLLHIDAPDISHILITTSVSADNSHYHLIVIAAAFIVLDLITILRLLGQRTG